MVRAFLVLRGSLECLARLRQKHIAMCYIYKIIVLIVRSIDTV